MMNRRPTAAQHVSPLTAIRSWSPIALILTIALMIGTVTIAQAAPAVPAKPTATSVGSTAVKVAWPAVSGAAKYTVRYSTSSSFSSPKDVVVTTPSTVVEGLTTGTTYYFKVAATDTSGATSGYSAYTSAKPAHTFAAPTGLVAENVGGTTIDLTWLNVPGSPGYRIQAVATGKPTLTFSTITERMTLTGLSKGTAYTLSVYVEQPPLDGLPALVMSPKSSDLKVTTSTYDLAAPTDPVLAKQTSTTTEISWTAPDGMQPGWGYQVWYALDSAMKTSAVWSAPVTGTSATLSGLKADTAYYARVRVVDEAGKQRSDISDYVLAKTLIATGTLRGVVSGAPNADVVVDAYDSSGELAQQASVASDGSYQFDLRPGTYKVQAVYIGTGNYTTEWAAPTGDGVMVPSLAQSLPVTNGGTTTATPVKLTTGGIVKGKVVDPSGQAVPDVYVTALSAVTSEREVLDQALTDSSGNYTLKGLPGGQYWLRMTYANDGFLTRSIFVSVSEGATLTTNATLDLASFRKTYKAYISGTKKVGYTLKATATAWLAGSYPTTWASMSVQWKRNGVPISGATGMSYKLTSSDKGKKISVTATATRYGYRSGSVTSSSYTIY